MRFTKKGFSLISLMITVGIVAILAIGIFSTLRPTEELGNARDAVIASTESVIERAIKKAAAENGELPVILDSLSTDTYYSLVKSEASTSGQFFCENLNGDIDRIDISAAVMPYLGGEMPVNENVTSTEDTGYYMIRRGNLFDVGSCRDYEEPDPDDFIAYHWTGATSSDWTDEANWQFDGDDTPGDDGYPDSEDINVVLEGSEDILMTGDITVGRLALAQNYSGNLEIDGTLNIVDTGIQNGDLVIRGGNISHPDNTDAETYSLAINVAGDFILGSGASINVDGLGYDPYYGPGTPSGTNSSGDGGAYGGLGGDGSFNNPAFTTTVYGSITAPTNLGSGGYCGSSNGGGAVVMTVGGTAIIDGVITADGFDIEGDSGGGCGGSGGSIFITAGNISGSGIIRADGGLARYAGDGGGGRVAVVLTNSNTFTGYTGVMSAYGGDKSQNGGAGTVYQELASDTANQGTLIIDNNDESTKDNPITTIPAGTNLNNFSNIIIRNGGMLGIDANTTINLATANLSTEDASSSYILIIDDALTTLPNPLLVSGYSLYLDGVSSYTGDILVDSDGVLGHSGNGTYALRALDMTINGNLTVNAGGEINAVNRGHSRGQGVGKSGSYNGASYGGLGADQNFDGNPSVVYGSVTNPVDIGSGSTYGYGGGAVLLNVTGYTILNGNIDVSGGGSGGTVNLTTASLSGSGAISSSGGYSSWAAGSGGGRVAIKLTGAGEDFSSYSGIVSAYGGESYNNPLKTGAAGTVYMEAATDGPGNGKLIIDNNSIDTLAWSTTHISSTTTDWEYGDVIVRNGAYLKVDDDEVSMTVSGDFTNTANLLLTDGDITFDGTGTQTITSNGDSFNDVIITNASVGGIVLADASSFANLTNTTAASKMTFVANAVHTVSSTLNLAGTAGNEIVLDSSNSTDRFTLDVTGGAQSVSYIDVSNSNASSNDITVTTVGSVSGGNNDDAEASPHWVFTYANPTPVVSAIQEDGVGVTVSWDQINDADFLSYRVVMSQVDDSPSYPIATEIASFTNNASTTYVYTTPINSGEDYYFSVTAVYTGENVPGNAIWINNDPPPDVSAVYEEGTGVTISWDQIDDATFQSYRVVMSTTTPNPEYPTDTELVAYTNNASTTYVYEDALVCDDNYYFSVTAVYDAGNMSGNAVTINDPCPTYPAPNVSASYEEGTGVTIYWDQLPTESLTGVKVVVSTVNPNPAYPGDGYIAWITNPQTTSYLHAVTLTCGQDYYYSATALYLEHSLYMAGNAITLNDPCP